MYNTDLPRRADLPTSAQLRRSTVVAALSAMVILVAVVLPSEYAIDPTGIGRLLGLTDMGEIKTQLAAEAEADRQAPTATGPTPSVQAAPAYDLSPPGEPSNADIAQRLDEIEALISATQLLPPSRFVKVEDQQSTAMGPTAQATDPADSGTASMPEGPAPAVATNEPKVIAEPGQSHEVSFTLAPGEGAEIKLVMNEGAIANFAWTANGSVVNFETHGDGGGRSVSYEKGRSVGADEGILEAAFDGNHGWFWRNRTDNVVNVTLRTSGDYVELKRML